MSETLRVFVSTTNDLESERAVVGRAVAELPIQIAVEIRRSPTQWATLEEVYERLANVDRVYFLLGNDITAPAGLEWHLAWRLERSILALRSTGKPTPAAQEFARRSPLPWREFRDSAELARLITLDAANLLQHPENRYGLTVLELERLAARVRHLERRTATAAPSTTVTGGAEGGAILLDGGRREPLAGHPLGE